MKKLREHIESAALKFLNIDKKELERKISITDEEIKKEWFNRKSNEEFYETSKYYLYGLIAFNDDERVSEIIYPLVGISEAEILDYGAGIGELGMCFSRGNIVYYYDVNKQNKEFAKFLSQKTNRRINILNKESDVFAKKYDIVILTDVLEHLKDPIDLIIKIDKIIKPKGLLLTTGLDFATGENHPQHLPENLLYRRPFYEFIRDRYTLMFYRSTKNEMIYLWVKK